jgi:hypothetical protein
MKTNLIKLTCGFALLGAAATAPAQSSITINFDNAIPGSYAAWTGNYTESGYTLIPEAYYNTQFRNWSSLSYNGTIFADVASAEWIGLTNSAGSSFSFDSIALGNMNIVGESVSIIGYMQGVQVASTTLDMAAGNGFSGATWDNLTLPSGFNNVDYVEINLSNNGYLMAFDNLVVTTAVPEPSTLALSVMGGLGMLWQLRRRK